jgi:hypothetical protein
MNLPLKNRPESFAALALSYKLGICLIGSSCRSSVAPASFVFRPQQREICIGRRGAER